MKVAFFYMGYESLGLEYLSAVLKAHGHETRLFFEPGLFNDFFFQAPRLRKFYATKEWLLEEFDAYDADLVGFSVVTNTFQWALDLARSIKARKDVPIVFGGAQPTSVPEIVMENRCVDYAVVGDGEYPLLELVGSLQAGEDTTRIPNVWARRGDEVVSNPVRPLFDGFEKLPWPDRELYAERAGITSVGYKTLVGRGCTNKCSYCFNSTLKQVYHTDRYIFRRPVDDVVAELRSAKARAPLDFIMFYDENFCADRSYILEFLKRYTEEIRAPFWCLIHPKTVDDEVVGALKEAGCVEVEMGIQSIKHVVAKDIVGRIEDLPDVVTAIRLFKKHGIFLSVDYILNLPKHSIDDLAKAALFFLDNRPDRVNLYWLTYYPGTRLTQRALEKGELTPEEEYTLSRGLRPRSVMTGGTVYERQYGSIHTLFLLLNVLPASWIRAIVAHRLHRFLPFLGFSLNTLLMYTLTYTPTKKTNKMEFMRTVLRYRRHVVRIPLRKASRRLARWHTPKHLKYDPLQISHATDHGGAVFDARRGINPIER